MNADLKLTLDQFEGALRCDSSAPVGAFRAAITAHVEVWQTAALMKDRTRRAIRHQLLAGDSVASIASDYKVPEAFVEHLSQWQLFADDPQMPMPPSGGQVV